jgi:hypothetical protein
MGDAELHVEIKINKSCGKVKKQGRMILNIDRWREKMSLLLNDKFAEPKMSLDENRQHLLDFQSEFAHIAPQRDVLDKLMRKDSVP